MSKKFIYETRVYYSDTDCGGIVYHTNYLNFAEHARTEMLRSISTEDQSDMMEKGIIFVVSCININYRKPGQLDDLLRVETQVEESKRFSMTFKQEIFRGDELLADLSVKVATIGNQRVAPVPQSIVDALTKE